MTEIEQAAGGIMRELRARLMRREVRQGGHWWEITPTIPLDHRDDPSTFDDMYQSLRAINFDQECSPSADVILLLYACRVLTHYEAQMLNNTMHLTTGELTQRQLRMRVRLNIHLLYMLLGAPAELRPDDAGTLMLAWHLGDRLHNALIAEKAAAQAEWQRLREQRRDTQRRLHERRLETQRRMRVYKASQQKGGMP